MKDLEAKIRAELDEHDVPWESPLPDTLRAVLDLCKAAPPMERWVTPQVSVDDLLTVIADALGVGETQ